MASLPPPSLDLKEATDAGGQRVDLRPYLQVASLTLALAIVSDGVVTEEELTSSMRLISRLPLFEGLDEGERDEQMTAAFQTVQETGLGGGVDEIARLAPNNQEIREELYGLAVLTVCADGPTTDPEQSFLDALSDALSVPSERAEKIAEEVRHALQ